MTTDAFLAELKKLLSTVPKPPLHIVNSENIEFSDVISYSKNLYNCFDTHKTTDSFYCYDCFICDNCGDCDYPVESQFCYESVDPFKCFNCDYVNYCANLRDCMYCDGCWSAHDLFGCVNLINKSFCIFNRQLTEGEFREQVKKYKTWPPEKVLAIVEELKKLYPMTQTIAAHNENSDYGNYIHYCKNCFMCFDAAHDENCGYLYDSYGSKNSYDMTYGGNKADFSYEIVESPDIFNCDFAVHTLNSQDSNYVFNCQGVKNCLGCVGLRHKEYCILNRQFSPEEYKQISNQILSELRAKNVGWNELVY